MKLTELEPQFIRYAKQDDGEYKIPVSVAEAQGLWFLCPLCFAANNGPVGTHACETTFANRGVADNQGSHNKDGQPTRWNVSGTDFTNLSLSPSVQLQGGCNWHGHITNGEITP